MRERKWDFLYNSPIKREKMETLLKGGAWAQKISAAASLHGQEKA